MANKKRRSNVDSGERKSATRSTERQSLLLPRNRRNVMCTIGIGLIPVLAILLKQFIALHYEKRKETHDEKWKDHRIPLVDREEEELNPERENQVRDFLNDFVCKYRPKAGKAGVNIHIADIDGYCHPRLSAEPHLRTQRVAIARASTNPWWRTLTNATTSDDGILEGELVMRLPRPLQIWDLDALRDKHIQREFLGLGTNGISDTEPNGHRKAARHKDTQNPLDSGAYLAVYLIRLSHGTRAEKAEQTCNSSDVNCNLVETWDDVYRDNERVHMLSAYLDILPAVRDRQRESNLNPHSHPLFWSSSLVETLFPKYTHTYDLIRHYQRMIESEYIALTVASEDFKRNVNNAEYLSMRINVLSRAFGVSASINDNGVLWGTSGDRNEFSLTDEMRFYETSNFGSFLSVDRIQDARDDKGQFKFRSMCPLLDMYNSHPNPNVLWRYDSMTSSYLIHANKNIPPTHSIVVSYGKYTDGHLFAKYGFVNGDGTSPTEISLAVFHRMLGDVGLGRQFSQLPFDVWDPRSRETIFEWNNTAHEFTLAKRALDVQAKELIRYLMFDDGYEECIDLNDRTGSEKEELKMLKMQHLIRIANRKRAWIVRIPPKKPRALPLQTDGSPTYEKKEHKKPVGLNVENILSTCRLLSLTADDIGEDSVSFLRKGLTEYGTQNSTNNSYFRLEKNGDALEFRAMMCVVRLCNVALGRYINYDSNEPKIVGSSTWNAWYIVSGEIRALGILAQTAAGEANKIKQRYTSVAGNSVAAMKVREEGACPLDYSLPLLDKLHL